MPRAIHRVSSIVKSIEDDHSVRRVVLGDLDDWALPPFTAGAHVDIYLPSGKVRQYSLCGDPAERNRYHIAVKLDPNGRGGSAELHEALEVGQELLLSLPRNFLPLVESQGQVIMVAGGIGITPFLSMLPELQRSGANYRLYYSTISPDATPLRDVLQPYTDHVHYHHDETNTRIDLADLIQSLGPEDQLYVCGPAPMLAAAEELGAHLGDRLHIEHFGAENLGADPTYEVEIASTGQVIPVPEGHTMLEALRMAEVDVPASCEGGICLDCKTRYLEGTPVHRDITMPKQDRADYLTPCVSGCDGGRIKLDL